MVYSHTSDCENNYNYDFEWADTPEQESLKGLLPISVILITFKCKNILLISISSSQQFRESLVSIKCSLGSMSMFETNYSMNMRDYFLHRGTNSYKHFQERVKRQHSGHQDDHITPKYLQLLITKLSFAYW